MEIFKEKQIIIILDTIGGILGIGFILSLVIGIFNPQFLVGLFLLPLSGVFIFPSFFLSKKDNYTRQFLNHIRGKIESANSLNELILVKNEFEKLAIKNNFYYLSFPGTLKEIHKEIINKIEILEKIKQNEKI
jgi:hypothetical protein